LGALLLNNRHTKRYDEIRPAASKISFAIVSGCDMSETWLAFTSIVFRNIAAGAFEYAHVVPGL